MGVALGVRWAAKAVALLPGLLNRGTFGPAVLLYHRVGAGSRSIDLERPSFEAQLADTPNVAALADMAAGSVVLTFDDGTDDFHTNVLPLLERYHKPATVYVCTGPVDERTPYPSWGDPSGAPAMTWSQLREAVGTGLVTVGSHTHTHADLDRVSPETATDELRRSKELIEDQLGITCDHFAYPHAVASPEAATLVRRYYKTAAVAGWRRNPWPVDPYFIMRIPITRSDSLFFFRAKVAGRMGAEAHLYRLFGRRPT